MVGYTWSLQLVISYLDSLQNSISEAAQLAEMGGHLSNLVGPVPHRPNDSYATGL